MIKALLRSRSGKRPPTVLVGLSDHNVTRLQAGEPIRFDLAELGLTATGLVILYGRTEEDIAAEVERAGLAPAGSLTGLGTRPGERKEWRRGGDSGEPT